MPSSNRKILLLFLVLLQLFAPLLHAHAGQQSPHFGFHIPGLEFYFGNQGSHLVNQTDLNLSDSEDRIVAMDDGIQENRASTLVDSHDDCCLPLLNTILSPVADAVVIQHDSEPPLVLSRTRTLPLSQRAPPII